MKTRIDLSSQAETFLHSLAPEPRGKLRLALRALPNGRGDVKALEDDLAGYYRLRVGALRVIYREAAEKDCRVLKCLFTERRAVVYELFTELLLSDLS